MIPQNDTLSKADRLSDRKYFWPPFGPFLVPFGPMFGGSENIH